jgi:hypothetical protein
VIVNDRLERAAEELAALVAKVWDSARERNMT